MLAIKAKKRDSGIKLATLRKSGEIPSVFYGAGRVSTPISISNSEFKKIWASAGESSAVKILMSEDKNKVEKDDINVLIHEVQVDPVTNEPIHVDFLAIDMKKKIRVKVQLDFIGVSSAVKNGIGNLVKVLHEIEIEAMPRDLPHNLFVDISALETLQDNIVVTDIKLPDGVIAITNSTDIVASIIEQKEEKEEVVVPVDLAAIEVEKKGKKEEGEAGVESAALAKEEKVEKAESKEKK